MYFKQWDMRDDYSFCENFSEIARKVWDTKVWD